MKWDAVLEELLDSIYNPAKKSEIDWVIMGSVATALQGIDIVPNDVDIVTKKSDEVYKFAKLMEKYTVIKSDEKSGPHNEDWRSSKEVPVMADEPNPTEAVWYFGRWYIDNFKIECAHISPPEDYLSSLKPNSGIWEAGPEVWPHIRWVTFKSYLVPVLPLEIQLETNFQRDLTDRIDKIISHFENNGYDEGLLKDSLSDENMRKFNLLKK